MDTSITLNEMDPSQSYTVTVCAENSLGRMCSTTTQLNNVEPLSLVAAKEKKPSLLIIVVAVVGSVVLIVLMCSTLLCCVFVCKCCHEKGHYYPSQEGVWNNHNNLITSQECRHLFGSAKMDGIIKDASILYYSTLACVTELIS